MKKTNFLLVTLTLVLFAATKLVAQQPFEGIIEFKKIGTTDTTLYTYTIKGNNVRIDEIDAATKRSAGTFIINLENKTQITINHERKLYMDKSSPATPVIKGACEIKKGKETKTMFGYKCQEYIVTNSEETTIIHYFLAEDKFTFFNPLLNILNRRDKASSYFLQIKEPIETFPLLSVQTDMKGRENGKLEVIKLNKRLVDPILFEVPKGYSKFEK